MYNKDIPKGDARPSKYIIYIICYMYIGYIICIVYFSLTICIQDERTRETLIHRCPSNIHPPTLLAWVVCWASFSKNNTAASD